MKKVKYGQPLYYYDERHDDFVNTPVSKKVNIDSKYKYISHNIFFYIFGFLLYHIIIVPAIWFITKVFFGMKVVGKKNLKGIKGGYILYSNHTHYMDCTFGYRFAAYPKRGAVICNPAAVRIKGINTIVRMLGALPLPEDISAYKNFLAAVDKHIEDGHVLIIMPEAHIWPYYTGIRKFPSGSFVYAAKNKVPAVSVTATYRKPKGPFKNYLKPRITLYIGKPIYPDSALSLKQSSVDLCEKVYQSMKESAEHNEVEFYKYTKVDKPIRTDNQIKLLKKKEKEERALIRRQKQAEEDAYWENVFGDDGFEDFDDSDAVLQPVHIHSGNGDARRRG